MRRVRKVPLSKSTRIAERIRFPIRNPDSPKCKERTFLTEDDGEHQSSELKTVMTHEFEDSNLAFVRDLFVFMNFTALSFVDLKELTTDNIVEVNGEKWIVGKRHKTFLAMTIPMTS